MKTFLKYFFYFWFIKYISCSLFCLDSSEPPQEIKSNSSYSINPVSYMGEEYTAVQVANKIFLNKEKGKFGTSSSGLYTDSTFCPEDFIIPKKEDYESIISKLGSNAYSVLTDENGFYMEEKTYYVTNTKGERTFSKYFMYLDGTNIKFLDSTPSEINGDLSQKAVCRCMLDLSSIKLQIPDVSGDLQLNSKTLIQTDSKYLNGYLWKVEDKIFETQKIECSFSKSGIHKIEFWGTYINGEGVYLCENVFVKKKAVPSSQTYDDSKVKLIETDFDMKYTEKLHFEHSNCPVSPRFDGGCKKYCSGGIDMYARYHACSCSY